MNQSHQSLIIKNGLWNVNILTRITDRKVLCVCSYLSNDIKNRGPGPQNSLRYSHDRKYFSGPSPTQNWMEARTIRLEKEMWEIWICFCWEKGNFTLIYQFKYSQTWKIWPSPLILSFYNIFKGLWFHSLVDN